MGLWQKIPCGSHATTEARSILIEMLDFSFENIFLAAGCQQKIFSKK